MLIGDMISAFRQGKELTNAATWKNRTIATTTIVGLLAALVSISAAFGYQIDVDQETLQQVGAGITAVVSLVSAVMHVITSAKVGLPAKPDPAGSDQIPANSVGADPEAVRKFLNGR